METIIYLGIGLVVGGILGYLIQRLLIQKNYIPKVQFDKISADYNNLKIELARYVSPESLSESYITKELYNHVSGTLDDTQLKLDAERASVLALQNQLTVLKSQEDHLNEKLELFTAEIEKIHKLSQEQFTNLANTILEEKGKAFVTKNKDELTHILDPLQTKLVEFKSAVENARKEDSTDMTTLKTHIEMLQKMSTEFSEDAKQLAQAIKGDSKIQGDWGEDRLMMIIEHEGLQKHIDYESQTSFQDEEEERRKRTDIIINLPNNKHIILDSKVSLKAYVDYFNEEDPEQKKMHLKKHIDSIKKHIEELSNKQYQKLRGISAGDHVFMFMPVEPALTLAMNQDPTIFNKALEKRVVLITPSTLVATLKIVRLLWQKEKQVKNVEEIFKQCGLLYDKFAGFAEDILNVGKSIENAIGHHKSAMNKLVEGKQKGDTIIGRLEHIKNLEARVSKKMPQKMLDEISMLEDETEFTMISEGEIISEDQGDEESKEKPGDFPVIE